jgi:hypothetical protein
VAPERADGGVSEPLFLGTLGAVRFAGLMPDHLGAGVYLMELALADSGRAQGRANLLLRWRPFDPDHQAADEVEPEERVLIEDIDALELSYFGAIDPEQPPDWWQVWEGRPDLPRLIRLQVRFADDDERRWPELIVHPMVDRAAQFGL